MWNKFERAADEILRQVVCDCGNYRHHGVGWMPEGSGEGKSVAVQIMQKLVEEETQKNTPGSLKQLRWAIYWVIDNYYSEDSRIAAEKRKQAVEELFKQYTNS